MPAARSGDTSRTVVRAGSLLAAVGTVALQTNLARLPVPTDHPPPVADAVSVLVPARDEAHRIGATIASLLAQTGLPDVEFLVLDDGSTDGTAAAVRAAAGGDPRLRVLTGAPPPPGRLGKPNACAQLAAVARGRVLVHVDADVELAPHAVAAAVLLLRSARLDLLSVWPRQQVRGVLGRLVQPLLAWSWLTTVPLRTAQRSHRPSLAVANGQFLLTEAAALRTAGGWPAVGDAVLDDIALARLVRRSGGRTGVADGSGVALCRMYASDRELLAGYRKSLWAAFGSPAGALAVAALLTLAYLVPPVAALTGSATGAAGYAVAVLGRLGAARWCTPAARRAAPAHPLSVLALVALLGWSWVGRVRGTLTWKGRPV